MNRKNNFTLVLLSTMIFVLTIAWWLDGWTTNLRKSGTEDFAGVRASWGISLANWIVAIFVVGLMWLVLAKGKNRIVGWSFLVAGLLVSLYPAIRFTFPLHNIPVLRYLLYNPNSYLAQLATFIAVLGGMSIILRERHLR